MTKKDKELIPVPQEIVQKSLVTPEMLNALENMRSRTVPPDKVNKRIAPGGKALDYVSHVWVTKQLQDGLGNLWSWEVLDWEIFDEILIIKDKEKESRSVVVRNKLTIMFPISQHNRIHPNDPMYYTQTITEVGTFVKDMRSMPTAFAVASAASRGLCKCVMRATGLGIQFYGDDDHIDAKGAWNALRRFVVGTQKMEWTDELRDEITERLKERLPNWPDDLITKFDVAFETVIAMTGGEEPPEEVPE